MIKEQIWQFFGIYTGHEEIVRQLIRRAALRPSVNVLLSTQGRRWLTQRFLEYIEIEL